MLDGRGEITPERRLALGWCCHPVLSKYRMPLKCDGLGELDNLVWGISRACIGVRS
jgi:hypothetical protein